MIDIVFVEHMFNVAFLLLAVLAAILAGYKTYHSVTLTPIKCFLMMFIYYGLYLIIPYLSWLLWQWSIDKKDIWEVLPMGLISLFLIYTRFIEPASLVIRHTPIQLQHGPALEHPLRVALIADIHIGLFSGRERQLHKIVEAVNLEKPDFIVISGDWTYEPNDHLKRDLQILSGFIAPVYSVPGNHDEEIPGPPVRKRLHEAIVNAGIKDIENQIVEMDEVRLMGVGDLWAGKADLDHLPELPQDKHWLLLAHNPDTVALVPPLVNRPLMLSGHTHGGQIELPWITSFVMRQVSEMGYKRGLYQAENAQVFVTIGTGLVGIPLRFRAPPTIDILHLT